MYFKSLLYRSGETPASKTSPLMPQFMIDLNIDQIISEVIRGKEEYELRPIFSNWPLNRDTITYRQQIMQEIDTPELYEILLDFSAAMRDMRMMLKNAIKCRYEFQKERLFMDSVYAYCTIVQTLYEKLGTLKLQSEGFSAFFQYLSKYVGSSEFIAGREMIEELFSEIGKIRYDLMVEGLLVRVLPYRSQDDYDKETRTLFSRFLSGNNKNYLEKFPVSVHMNDVEAQILKGVATLYPAVFDKIVLFYLNNQDFQDEIIQDFDRDVHFYLSYLEYFKKIEVNGSPFCYPEITPVQADIFAFDTFDTALASHLVALEKKPVLNNFSLSGKERIIFVSGPNQGGKTTFARTFGQVHYFGNLGLPVAGSNAKILHCDNILTHFEKSEDIQLQQSKLENDLNRIHAIIQRASTRSIIILNEIFSSTTLLDSKFLSSKIIEQVEKIGSYCVWVTFIEELSAATKTSISMSATVNPESPDAERTFKIIKKDPDGKAYARSLAERYGLSFNQLLKRIAS
ncbi:MULTISPECIES: MutS-related protein [Chryseobacterium]|uniref:DNA mismatch repair protein mutS n=2 Tax=Chryseobacterium gleum TaxID=250 RepID=A0A3S4M450_CHRGE|nr:MULTISPECIES: DNA mismatch repair protein MutS [Chryseobacterium]EFK36133.1 hypothetical protein HMPREF0204_15202 [Chryseobacterium gleum ATCC 35910]QQY31831.1 hypothetical protein I6I60_23795 [Chryseobacterium gleum]VEE11069.1 DNA mismatch repair protein mutS [Chryseobacterium gleum]VFA43941.1 DNA mismatch repair protein mutS [Chryseobacterium indologenes]